MALFLYRCLLPSTNRFSCPSIHPPVQLSVLLWQTRCAKEAISFFCSSTTQPISILRYFFAFPVFVGKLGREERERRELSLPPHYYRKSFRTKETGRKRGKRRGTRAKFTFCQRERWNFWWRLATFEAASFSNGFLSKDWQIGKMTIGEMFTFQKIYRRNGVENEGTGGKWMEYSGRNKKTGE